MKRHINPVVLTVLVAALVPLAVTAQTTFFSDNFSNGSTINSLTPTNPTPNSASYEFITSDATNYTSISANDLRFGITNAGGGNICEIQAIFATNAIALTEPGDYIQLTVVFTNFSGIYCNPSLGPTCAVGFGLFNGSQVFPLAGGFDTEGTGNASGGVQNWAGYMAFLSDTTSSLHNQIYARPSNASISTSDNQDLTTQGSGTKSFSNNGGIAIGPVGTPTTVPASTNIVYTNILTITLKSPGLLGVTDNLYNATSLVTTLGGTNTAAGYTSAAFDGLAVGFYKKGDNANTPYSNIVDVASIMVSGSVTVISGPPTITLQPINVSVPNGEAGAFIVNAQGFNTTYQWHRNGTNLNTGGNISVVNSLDGSSSILAISSASAADVTSTYYVTVSGAGGYNTNSATASLSLTTATTLYWGGSAGALWDVNTSANWNTDDSGSANLLFNFGDPVIFDDGGAGGSVTLNGPYLSAASVTVNEQTVSFPYTWTGTGSFAGPGNLIYMGSTKFIVNNANTFSGGTIISNATAYLTLGNLNGLGTGPVTLAYAGGQMEIVPTASSSTAIASDFIVASNFAFIVDATNNAFGAVFNGNFSGTSGQTLTIQHNPGLTIGTNATRIRAAGNDTVYNANLILGLPGDTNFLWACYQTSNQTYNGVISGPGSYMQKAGATYLNNQNTYSGTTTPAAGVIGLGVSSVGSPGAITSGPIGTGVLLLMADSSSASPSASAEVFASGGDCTIANAIQFNSTTNDLQLLVGSGHRLTFTGPANLNGNDNFSPAIYTNRTISVSNSTTFSGVISDGGKGIGLIRNGPGSLYLDGPNTYTGLTRNNNSTTNGLALLAGSGTIAGPVIVQTNSSIGGGSASVIGTLTINGYLTNNGNVFIRVNKSLSPAQSNDLIAVTGALANAGTGTVMVTNIGVPALATGDTFQIFSQPVNNGAALAITGGGMIWSNRLALDGTIQALSVIVTVATNSPYLTNMVVGNTLYFSWALDHQGWILQVQTNSLAKGLGTNWVNIPGTEQVTSTNVTIDAANESVFYRLIYYP